MHLRSYPRALPRAALVAVLLLALALPLGSTASAQSTSRQRCAVGLRLEPGYGYATIIRVYSSIDNQGLVQGEAALCTELIAQGWFAESSYGEWQARFGGAYYPVCYYRWPWGDSVNVYALPGNTYWARLDCSGFYDGSLYWF